MSSESAPAKDGGAFASLSSTLLARKGHARPAMRPQGFHASLTPSSVSLDDLGWNDMGTDAAQPVPLRPTLDLSPMEMSPEPPVPVQQQAEIEREFAAPVATAMDPVAAAPAADPVAAAPAADHSVAAPAADHSVAPSPIAPRAAPGSKAKAAFTLRLDGERHLRLRLVCAVTHRSAQQIVTQALDEFLARQPGNAELAITASTFNKSY